MTYQFLVDTYATERLKTLSMWSVFRDEDMERRPHATDPRGRSVREQMVHQCVSENLWFVKMLGIAVGPAVLPDSETRMEFLRRYAADSKTRLDALATRDRAWWEAQVSCFGEPRNRAWIMVRRIAHTAHHRGQQSAMARMLNRDLYSTYGPTADTGGLMQSEAPTVYAYTDVGDLLSSEAAGGRKADLPGPGNNPATERPATDTPARD